MNMRLLFLSLMLILSASAFAQVATPTQPKVVIYIQDLLNKNSNGASKLIKEATEAGVILEWESYNGLFNKFIENPNPAAGYVDFVITEVEGYKKKGGWKGYRTLKYVLTDAYTKQVLKTSEILHESYAGGCKPNGMCVQVQGSDKQLGTSKTNALMELVLYAKNLVEKK